MNDFRLVEDRLKDVQIDRVSVGEEQRLADHVPQLADVARPGLPLEKIQCRAIDR